MSMRKKTLRVGLVQTAAGPDPGVNLDTVTAMMETVPECDLIALPEVFGVRGSHGDYVSAAQPVPGPTTHRLASIAAGRGCWLLLGSVIEQDGDSIFNTSVLIDRDGMVAATYRKIHLFEAHLDDGRTIRESDDYQAGACPAVADLDGWRCGLSVCYDVRFPELYRRYAQQGADILLIPANFTQRTGRDHWEVLLRARAIENQCFVVAPGQCGVNLRTGVVSYGNSMVVDPWGGVSVRAGNDPGVVTADLDPEVLALTRRRIPVLDHRRLA